MINEINNNGTPEQDNALFTELDKKIISVFPDESVHKNPANYSVFQGRNLPSFIKDWLVKYFSHGDRFDREQLIEFLEKRIPKSEKESNLRADLLHSKKPLQIISRMLIHTDLLNGKMGFSIPDLQIGAKEGVVPRSVAQSKIDYLHEGEVWGILTLTYIPPLDKEKGYVELSDFKPFQPYKIHLKNFFDSRKEFTTLEWIDVLIRSMEYNPDYYDGKLGQKFTLSRKLTFLSRLLVFVEPNLNMIELAPKGTGKSYVFGNLSKYGWIVGGGKVTRAGLFYNISTKTPGIIQNYDFLALDEIETLKFASEEEILGAFKNYLENGRIIIDKYKGTSTCGLMLLGNIKLDRNLKPKSRDYFLNLPDFFHSSALIDRIHGFVEGWDLFRFNEDMKVKGMALNSEFFSEIMHLLRTSPYHSNIIDECLELPSSADTRDTKAVKKICSGYLKLLYPHAQSCNDIPREEFVKYVFEPAMGKRAIIRQQLSEIDSEYSPNMPDIKCREW